MNKHEKFRDKNYIMNCDMPSELFTVKGIKNEYRTLAKMWHPDISEVKEALFIMSKINALYNEGQLLIEAHKFYEKERLLNPNRRRTVGSQEKDVKNSASHAEKRPPSAKHENETPDIKRSKKKRVIELKDTMGKCVRFRYLRRVLIELGFMYVSEEYILLEVTKLKRKIYLDSIETLRGEGEGYFKISVPNVIDTFETATHGYLVFKKEKGVEPVVTLELVSGYLKPLASRKICEGIFYDLTALKHIGLTSTGIDKSLIFIDVTTGKLHNYGLFFYLHEFNSKLNRAPKEVSETLKHLKPKSSESLIIDLVKNTIVRLNVDSGLLLDDFGQWIQTLNSDSLEASLAESQVFNRAIASVTNHGFNLDGYYAEISNMN